VNDQVNRRQFLKGVSLLSLCGMATGSLRSALLMAEEPGRPATRPAIAAALKVSLNAYSFNKLLNDNIRKRGPGVTLLQVLDFAAQCKFDAFDPTGYFFPGYPKRPDDAYVDAFRGKAADLGLALSGTGVRNNFTTSDKAVRDDGVRHIKEWVEVAARLGAPVVRVFADTQMRSMTWKTVAKGYTREQVQEWIAAALRQCADHGKQFGVRIGVQNHGDFLQTGEELLALVKAVDSAWCGPLVDTGYFKTRDPYADMALVAPHAVSWQIKQSPLGEDSDVPTDLVRLMHIIRDSGYRGYLPIETLSPRGKEYDPYQVVPAFLKQLRDAIAQTA
jgi:sugar phosphate isomerase/epimerase